MGVLPKANTKGRFLVAASLLLLAAVAGCGGDEEDNPFAVKSELVTTASRPIALTFAPDGRLFYAEHHTGQIRVITADGTLRPEAFAKVDVATYATDWGLTGLALDPKFETNHYVYAFFTQVVDPEPITGTPVIVRFTDRNDQGVEPKVILDGLPATESGWPGYKTNGSMHFGPDGFLYLSIGDYDRLGLLGPGGKQFAQDLTIAPGKLLRINKEDGEAPPDNPLVDQPGVEEPRIFAYGFSRQFDFAFHPETEEIYGSDNTASCEELNVIEPGGNYGWPDVGEFPWPDCFAGDQIEAIHFFTLKDTQAGVFLSGPAVTGLEFVSGAEYPVLGDSLLACESDPGILRRVVLSPPDFRQVTASDVVVEDCKFDITTSPDGVVYYSNESEIRRLVQLSTATPEEEE